MATLKGGTLAQLAGDNGTTIEALQGLNPNLNTNTTYSLGEVKLPGATGGTATPTALTPTQPAVPQTGLSKVATQGIGPDGKPIYDVFAGQEHIADPNDTRLKGVDIAGLQTGQAPTAFKSKFNAGFDQANKDLGGQMPEGSGAGIVGQYTPSKKNDIASYFTQNDEVVQGMADTLREYMSPTNQRESLAETYTLV